ncbi:hypothetical protein MVEG_01542 [Podila verticillata NRRL 6337]|nr:hypothetical protein MVEG_01542 [Podila verticillata NRRL 6337]
MDLAVGLNRQELLMEKPEQPAYISLRGAIDLLVPAWNDVTPQTLHNCFQHCDIRTASRDSSDNEQAESSSETELDQGALRDREDSHDVLSSTRPELFPGHLDIRSLLYNSDEDIIGFEKDEDLDSEQREQLLEEEDDELPLPEDDSEEAPKITRQEAMESLLCLGTYLQQQDEDMGPERAIVKRLLDQIESKQIFQLQQTSIQTYFC